MKKNYRLTEVEQLFYVSRNTLVLWFPTPEVPNGPLGGKVRETLLGKKFLFSYARKPIVLELILSGHQLIKIEFPISNSSWSIL